MTVLVPYVVKNTPKGERGMDIFSRLMDDRIIFVTGQVEQNMATSIIAQLLFMESENNFDITMYIDSPGGSVTAGMSIINTMNFIRPDVGTLITGQGASMGSLIALSGAKGKRFMLPDARHMIHQPSGGFGGQATDAEIHVEELIRWKKRLTEMYCEVSGKDFEAQKADMERDNFMDAPQSVAYGLADEIITSRE